MLCYEKVPITIKVLKLSSSVMTKHLIPSAFKISTLNFYLSNIISCAARIDNIFDLIRKLFKLLSSTDHASKSCFITNTKPLVCHKHIFQNLLGTDPSSAINGSKDNSISKSPYKHNRFSYDFFIPIHLKSALS